MWTLNPFELVSAPRLSLAVLGDLQDVVVEHDDCGRGDTAERAEAPEILRKAFMNCPPLGSHPPPPPPPTNKKKKLKKRIPNTYLERGSRIITWGGYIEPQKLGSAGAQAKHRPKPYQAKRSASPVNMDLLLAS